jgi:hypothetical protein
LTSFSDGGGDNVRIMVVVADRQEGGFMNRIVARFSLAAALAASAAAPVPAGADVHVGVHIGLPLPPIVIAPPVVLAPPVVMAPPVVLPAPIVVAPPVVYAPGFSGDVFLYGGLYYTVHGGSWFVTGQLDRPWRSCAPARVPRPLLSRPYDHRWIGSGHGWPFRGGYERDWQPRGGPRHLRAAAYGDDRGARHKRGRKHKR